MLEERDLVRDRTRAINRLRSALTGMFPALERALVLTSAGPLVLLDGYQTPAVVRRMGTARLPRWLRTRGVRSPEEFATTAVEAAEQRHTVVPDETVIAQRDVVGVPDVGPGRRREGGRPGPRARGHPRNRCATRPGRSSRTGPSPRY